MPNSLTLTRRASLRIPLRTRLADAWDTIQWNQGHSWRDDACHAVFGTVGAYHLVKHLCAALCRYALPLLLRCLPVLFPLLLAGIALPFAVYYRRVVEQGNKRYFQAKGMNQC